MYLINKTTFVETLKSRRMVDSEAPSNLVSSVTVMAFCLSTKPENFGKSFFCQHENFPPFFPVVYFD